MLITPILQYHDTAAGDITHYFCRLRPDVGLCGTPITDETPNEADCVVCIDIDDIADEDGEPICPWSGQRCDCCE